MQKLLIAFILAAPGTLFAQRHELGLTLGGISSQDRGLGLRLSGGTALQANYGYRVWGNDTVAVLGEVHFLANGQRKIESADPRATRDVATLYVTPGVRVKFAPNARVSPYFAIGGGYALYEQSHFQQNGADNPAPRFLHRGAFDFGGGVDVKFWRWIGLRGEIRDFYTGSPAFNTSLGGGQHNVVAGGGFVIKWGS
jgi:opacity protein-like surface antigen